MQILRDVPKARREVDLHWRVAAHENVVNLIDIYENVYMGQRSLLVVMEWLALYNVHLNMGHLWDIKSVLYELPLIQREVMD